MDSSRPDAYGHWATPEQMDRKHVFVVNGAPEFLDLVRELLQDEQYNVTTTNFVPQSFATIAAAQPAALVIDLAITERAGWNLLRELRRAVSTRDIPVLLVSTSWQLIEDARAQHEEFGGDRYLSKPFNIDDLLNAIQELIGSAEAEPKATEI